MTLQQLVLVGALCVLGASAPGQARAEPLEFVFSGTAKADLSQDSRTGGASGPSNVPDSLASFLLDGTTVEGRFLINADTVGFVLPSGIAKGGTQYLLLESKLQFGSIAHFGGPACDAFFADCSLVVFNNSDAGDIPGLRVDRLLLPSFRQFTDSRPSDISYLLAQFVIEDSEFALPGEPQPDLYANDQLGSVLPTLDSTRPDNNLRYSLIYFGRTVSGVEFRRTFDVLDVAFGPVGAVPEPSAWAMGLVGLALLGCALRRDGKRAARR